jgi:hypothetical protein
MALELSATHLRRFDSHGSMDIRPPAQVYCLVLRGLSASLAHVIAASERKMSKNRRSTLSRPSRCNYRWERQCQINGNSYAIQDQHFSLVGESAIAEVDPMATHLADSVLRNPQWIICNNK